MMKFLDTWRPRNRKSCLQLDWIATISDAIQSLIDGASPHHFAPRVNTVAQRIFDDSGGLGKVLAAILVLVSLILSHLTQRFSLLPRLDRTETS